MEDAPVEVFEVGNEILDIAPLDPDPDPLISTSSSVVMLVVSAMRMIFWMKKMQFVDKMIVLHQKDEKNRFKSVRQLPSDAPRCDVCVQPILQPLVSLLRK